MKRTLLLLLGPGTWYPRAFLQFRFMSSVPWNLPGSSLPSLPFPWSLGIPISFSEELSAL